MKKISCLFALCCAMNLLHAQTDTGYIQSDDGIRYKIFSAGATGDVLKAGNFFEFSFRQIYKDSLLYNSDDYANQVAPFDSAQMPKTLFNMFSKCRKGDSIVIQILTDSAFKGQQMPPLFASGQYFTSSYKIFNIFTERAAADSASKVQNAIAEQRIREKEAAQMAIDDYKIKAYLDEKGIKATRLPSGVYVQTIAPGIGKPAGANAKVKVNYTGRNLGGTTFDSNTDPAFGHVTPYEVDIAAGGVVQGWLEALPIFTKGMKATVYIPSALGYGSRGAGNDIAPNSILVFDMQVIGITSPKAAAPKAPVKKAPVKKVPVKRKPTTKTKTK
jgi:FKBP-type peptidyl-prolyl cis-trans isomerase FkpA